MSDTASSSVEAYLEKLKNLAMVGNPVGPFRGILVALYAMKITHSHDELRRTIIEDAVGLKRTKDPLVLQALKHIRSEKRRTEAQSIYPRASGGVTATIHREESRPRRS